jgi:hypothetical protein
MVQIHRVDERSGVPIILVSFVETDRTCQQPPGAEARLGPPGLGSWQVYINFFPALCCVLLLRL